jgi:hypothetical protein
MRHVQPIRDFDRHDPQSSLYVNSGFRPECAIAAIPPRRGEWVKSNHNGHSTRTDGSRMKPAHCGQGNTKLRPELVSGETMPRRFSILSAAPHEG